MTNNRDHSINTPDSAAFEETEAAAEAMAARIGALQVGLFQAHIGTVFLLHAQTAQGPVTVPLTLTEAAVLPERSQHKRQRRVGFVLTFRYTEPVAIGQGAFRLTHPAMDEVEIFLVPIGPDPDHEGNLLEAVFN